jgi:hypothetical protein
MSERFLRPHPLLRLMKGTKMKMIMEHLWNDTDRVKADPKRNWY